MSRVPISDAARIELQARYRVRHEAELNLASYLRGLVDALSIDPATLEGFDDVAGELLIADQPEEPAE